MSEKKTEKASTSSAYGSAVGIMDPWVRREAIMAQQRTLIACCAIKFAINGLLVGQQNQLRFVSM
jgi:hypothetical protein